MRRTHDSYTSCTRGPVRVRPGVRVRCGLIRPVNVSPAKYAAAHSSVPVVLVPGTGVEPVRPKGPADFTYHRSFRYHAPVARFVVWTIPLPYAVRQLGRGRLVSTLSHVLHGLSSGLPSARPVKGSPNLTPFHPRVSPWRTPTSPLRLPIPPPGQCESAE